MLCLLDRKVEEGRDGEGIKKAGRVIKSLAPGAPGTKQWQERYGDRPVRVRYRGHPKRRMRCTTVEIIVEEAFWDPEGYQAYKVAMSDNGHSA